MLELMKKLEDVQELDLVIDKILKTRDALPLRLAQFELDIKTKTNKRADLAKKFDELNKSDSQQRGMLELNDSRAKRSQERLAGVKTGDEYQALQKELENLKKSTLAVQDAQTKLRDEVKRVEGEIQTIDAGINDVKAKMTEEQGKIDVEAGGANKNLEELQGKRKALTAALKPNAYEDTLGQGWHRIALVTVGVCRLQYEAYAPAVRGSSAHAGHPPVSWLSALVDLSPASPKSSQIGFRLWLLRFRSQRSTATHLS